MQATEELENELISLDNEPDAEKEDQPKSSSRAASASVEERGSNPLVQSNTVGLFGPGVSEFWVKKTKTHKKRRIRRGLTKGMRLPENVEALLGIFFSLAHHLIL